MAEEIKYPYTVDMNGNVISEHQLRYDQHSSKLSIDFAEYNAKIDGMQDQNIPIYYPGLRIAFPIIDLSKPQP